MGEAYVGGHEILNHRGERIRVTRETIKELDKRNYLRRDRPTGLLQIKPWLYRALLILENGDRPTKFMRELGPDLSGPNVPKCNCRQCKRISEDLEDSRLSVMRTEQIIGEMRSKNATRST